MPGSKSVYCLFKGKILFQLIFSICIQGEHGEDGDTGLPGKAGSHGKTGVPGLPGDQGGIGPKVRSNCRMLYDTFGLTMHKK